MPNGALPTSAAARRGHVTASDYRPTRARLYIPPVRHLVAKHQNFRINFHRAILSSVRRTLLFIPMISRHFSKILRLGEDRYANCSQWPRQSRHSVRFL